MERSALLSWSFVLHLVEWRCVGVISRHCHSMPHLTALNGQMLTKHEHNEIWTASVRYALNKRYVCTYCRYATQIHSQMHCSQVAAVNSNICDSWNFQINPHTHTHTAYLFEFAYRRASSMQKLRIRIRIRIRSPKTKTLPSFCNSQKTELVI